LAVNRLDHQAVETQDGGTERTIGSFDHALKRWLKHVLPQKTDALEYDPARQVVN
jgi:hypothetical protein